MKLGAIVLDSNDFAVRTLAMLLVFAGFYTAIYAATAQVRYNKFRK